MIEISHLTKKYGEHLALDDISLEVLPGRIYGFLGPNGAGKSTTMNIISGYLAATSGSVKINDIDIFKRPEEAKRYIGYLPEIPPLYTDMTVREYLSFVAELKKISRDKRRDELEEAMEKARVTDVSERLIKNLSKGYKQRVGLAQAIMGKPQTVILDEPTVGLDPKQIIEIRELIKEIGKEHTVILSSHILPEISEVCDHVFIISKGKLVASDSTETLLENMSGSRELSLTVKVRDPKAFEEALKGISHVSMAAISEPKEEGLFSYTIKGGQDTDIREDVYKTCVREDAVIYELSLLTRSLEDVFLELTKEDEGQN